MHFDPFLIRSPANPCQQAGGLVGRQFVAGVLDGGAHLGLTLTASELVTVTAPVGSSTATSDTPSIALISSVTDRAQ
jgi:hypothetical protein